MKPKKPQQPKLDFERTEEREYCKYPRDLKTNCQNGSEANPGTIHSFAEKIAEKEEEHKNRLYEGILSRIKHLSLK